MAGHSVKAGGKRVVVLAVPGDRRNEDIEAIARRAARSFDHFICRRDDNPRGRGEEEVPRLLRDTLIADTQEMPVAPRKTDVRVSLFGVAWMPHYLVENGGRTLEIPAYAAEE